jgi:hypothetical protein
MPHRFSTRQRSRASPCSSPSGGSAVRPPSPAATATERVAKQSSTRPIMVHAPHDTVGGPFAGVAVVDRRAPAPHARLPADSPTRGNFNDCNRQAFMSQLVQYVTTTAARPASPWNRSPIARFTVLVSVHARIRPRFRCVVSTLRTKMAIPNQCAYLFGPQCYGTPAVSPAVTGVFALVPIKLRHLPR